MLGLVLLYFIGKMFYELALKHDRNKWLFAILSVIVYYAGTVIGAVILFVISMWLMDIALDEINEAFLGLLTLPFGILACWLFYRLLKSSWTVKKENLDILDQDL